jgi:transcriptional regulator with XRE-family HTH domain
MKPNQMSLAFGRLLRERRISLGATQEELAEEVGISQAHVSKMETGMRLPTYATTRRLAKFLGMRWLQSVME